MDAVESGTLLAGRYLIQSVMRRSLYGAAYLAQDTGSGLSVVVQVLSEQVEDDTSSLAALRRNFSLLHVLDHPHIAKVHALEYAPELCCHFLVQEHVVGVSLREYRLSMPGQKVQIVDALSILRQVSDALDHAHRSLLHRNINPDSIIIDSEGSAKICCFWLLSDVSLAGACPPTDSESELSETRVLCCMAPEQFAHPPMISPASDRWALAVVFYELIFGRLPFDFPDAQSLQHAICHAAPAQLAGLGKSRRWRAAEQVFAQAFAKDPHERFPSAMAFVRAVDASPFSCSMGPPRRVLPSLLGGGFLVFFAWTLTPILLPFFSGSPDKSMVETAAVPFQKEAELTPDLKKSLLLRVESQPTGAAVVLDGKRLGVTPFTVGRVSPGAYHLWLEKQGFKPIDIEMDLTQDTIVSMNLDALPSEKPTVLDKKVEPNITEEETEKSSPENMKKEVSRVSVDTVVQGASVSQPSLSKKSAALPAFVNEALLVEHDGREALEASSAEQQQGAVVPEAALEVPEEEVTPTEEALPTAVLEVPEGGEVTPTEEVLPTAVMAEREVHALKIQIQTLLRGAARDLERTRLTQPKGRNALEKYRAIQALDPRNPEARAGILRIVEQLLALANTDIKAGNLTQPPRRNAATKLLAALDAAPHDPSIGREIARLMARYLSLAPKTGQTPVLIRKLLDQAAITLPEDPNVLAARQVLLLPELEISKDISVVSPPLSTYPAQSPVAQTGWNSELSSEETALSGREGGLALSATPPEDSGLSPETEISRGTTVVSPSPSSTHAHLSSPTQVEEGGEIAQGKGVVFSEEGATLGPVSTISKPENRELRTWREPTTDLVFVWVKGGCYHMGSNQGGKDEVPVHQVCLRGFWLGRHEVTQGAWQRVMVDEENPSKFQKGGHFPLDSVSWDAAQQFIHRLNAAHRQAKSRNRFRLPTEAQWEYACRSGHRSPFSFGNSIHAGKANFNGEREFVDGPKGHYVGHTLPVGSFSANRFGLFDMHGNVYEWVDDLYRDSYREVGAGGRVVSSVPQPTQDKVEARRVLRGGAWYSNPRDLRCAHRYQGSPAQRHPGNGFRLLREDSPRTPMEADD